MQAQWRNKCCLCCCHFKFRSFPPQILQKNLLPQSHLLCSHSPHERNRESTLRAMFWAWAVMILSCCTSQKKKKNGLVYFLTHRQNKFLWYSDAIQIMIAWTHGCTTWAWRTEERPWKGSHQKPFKMYFSFFRNSLPAGVWTEDKSFDEMKAARHSLYLSGNLQSPFSTVMGLDTTVGGPMIQGEGQTLLQSKKKRNYSQYIWNRLRFESGLSLSLVWS